MRPSIAHSGGTRYESDLAQDIQPISSSTPCHGAKKPEEKERCMGS